MQIVKPDAPQKARKRALRKFLYYFKNGYRDKKFIEWERQYKFNAHLAFEDKLNFHAYAELLQKDRFAEIARIAASIESKTNLLFSFEKMALRDAIKSRDGAKRFAEGLFDYIYGKTPLQVRFEAFADVIGSLPRRQTRVLTWPLLTVFGFIARPDMHMFLKPRVTQAAADKYKFDFIYNSKPAWETYESLIDFAEQVRKDTMDYGPRDYIDLQSFIWVLGSEEYDD